VTISTLTPSSTVSATGVSITQGGAGANTASSVLAHVGDDSFITLDEGEFVEVNLSDLTLPADALIKQVRLRLRLEKTGITNGYTDMQLRYEASGVIKFLQGKTLVNWTVPQTVTSAAANVWEQSLLASGVTFTSLTGDAFDDAELDAATLTITNRTLPTTAADMIVYEAYVDAVYVTQPVVGVGIPSGTVTDNSAPIVYWLQALDSEEPTSSHFQAKVFTDDQVTDLGFDPDETPTFFNSGVVARAYTTAGAWDIASTGLGLPDNDYHAYVRTAVTVNGEQLWSDWDSNPFTIDLDRPGQPSLAASADNDNARIALTLEGQAGDTDTDYFEVQRSDDGETTWHSVRTALGDGLVVGPDEVLIYDYEAPNGVAVSYRARARHDFSPGLSFSDWSDAISLWSSEEWWLKHPTLPSMNFSAGGEDSAWFSYPGHSRTARQGVFQPIGSSDVIVVSDKRGPRTGTFSIRLDEDARKGELDDLLETESPLLVQGPADHHEPDRWVSIGDNERTRVIDKGWSEPTTEALQWTEVPRPELPGTAGILTVTDEEPEDVPTSIDFDSFNAGATGTGTLSWTHTPTNDGVVGAVIGIVADQVATVEVNAATVEGLAMEEIGTATVPGPDGTSALYFLGSAIPEGPLDFSVTVTGASAKRACSWLIYGSGETSADDVLELVQINSATATGDLTTTAETVVVGCAWLSPNDIALVDAGTGYTPVDHEHDFGINVGLWEHRSSDPAAGTVAFNVQGADANTDYAIVAVAVRVGVAVAPGGSSVLKEDLATIEDPTGGNNANSLWRKADSAYATFSGDFNWTAGDLQQTRLSADPDPHHPVDAADSTHYRRTTMSEVYLVSSLASGATPTTLAVTADADFPVPTSATCSVIGQRAFHYTGRTGSFPNYTLTGVTWIDTTGAFSASTRVGIQSTFDAGVPNDSYRTQLQRWSAIPSNTFYLFEPGMRRQIVLSVRFDTDHLPWPLFASNSHRSMVWQIKPSPSGGIGPIIEMRQYGDTDRLEVRHDTTGTSSAMFPAFSFDPSVGWIRLMMDITFQPSGAAGGRFRLFGDLDGDKLDFEDMVPLSANISTKTCGSPTDPYGEVSGFGIGPYAPMLVPAHWREYANIQVIDPEA